MCLLDRAAFILGCEKLEQVPISDIADALITTGEGREVGRHHGGRAHTNTRQSL
jgi:hypothetical protein